MVLSPGWADWIQTGGALNTDSAHSAAKPFLAVNQGTPYVAWAENNGSAFLGYVKYFNGSSWQPVAGILNVNSGHTAGSTVLAFSAGTPYVAWQEENGVSAQVYVKRYTGGQWQQVGSWLNQAGGNQAQHPWLTFSGTTPYVAWEEANAATSLIYVKRYNGAGWEMIGTPLNVNAADQATNPKIEIGQTTPFVTWIEFNGSHWIGYLKAWNGADWESYGAEINRNTWANFAWTHLAVLETTPFVSWIENDGVADQAYVAQYSGAGWDLVGGSLNLDGNQNSASTTLAFLGATPYAAWTESNGVSRQLEVRFFQGGSWQTLGSSLNLDTLQDADGPDLGFSGTTPYVVWDELNSAGVYQVYVKHEGVLPTPTLWTTPPTDGEDPGLEVFPSRAHPSPDTPLRFQLHLRVPRGAVLRVYDLAGRQVYSREGSYPAGFSDVFWDGGRAGSGLYIAGLESEGKRVFKKFILVR